MKKIMQYGIAQETIDFQTDGKFYAELTLSIEELKGFGVGMSDELYFKSNEIRLVTETIRDHTDISVVLGNGVFSTYPITLDNSKSIFTPNYIKTYNKNMRNTDPFVDSRNILGYMGEKIIEGSISLAKSRVYGAFTKFVFIIFVPRDMLEGKTDLSPGEIASVIMHEIGHIFNNMEYISRVVKTNQVLAGMVRSLDKSVPSDIRRVLITKGSELLKMTEEERLAVLNAKDEKTLTCVVVDSAVKLCVNELGASVYDSVSCEQLADLFATRHGCGKNMVIAYDKLNRYSGFGPYEKTNYTPILHIAGIFGISILANPLFGVLYSVLLGVNTCNEASKYGKEYYKYDNDYSRFNRIKLQNIELLKDKKISKELKIKLISDNEIIDKTMDIYKNNLSFIEKVAYYLKPSYRNAHKYELMEKDLETLSGNELFTSAAKLSTV